MIQTYFLPFKKSQQIPFCTKNYFWTGKKILNFGTVIILNFFPHVSDHTGLPPKTNAGLGRRAITQLEMSTAGLNTSSRRPLASARPWPQPLRMDVIKVSSTFRVDLSFQRVFFID